MIQISESSGETRVVAAKIEVDLPGAPRQCARERNAVQPVLVVVPKARELLLREPAEAARGGDDPGAGILNHPDGGVVVSRAPRPTSELGQPAARAVFDFAARATLSVGEASHAGEVPPKPGVRVFVNLMVGSNRVHHTAERVRPVKKCCRSLDHFQPFETCRVDRFAVVARLAGKGSGSNSILEDQDPVAVEAADDRTAGARPEAPLGDAGLVFEHLADAPFGTFRELEDGKTGYGLEGFKGGFFPCGSGHGDFFSDRGQGKCKIQPADLPANDFHCLPLGGQLVPVSAHGVGSRRNLCELIAALFVGVGVAAQFQNRNRGIREGIAVCFECYVPTQISVGLTQ